MLMNTYPYNFTEINKFDLGKRVNHLFEIFPDLFSICLEVQQTHIFKKGKPHQKKIIFDISKAVIKDRYNNLIDWSEKNHCPDSNSNSVFHFILNFFYKKNFQLVSNDGTYFNWDEFKNYLTQSSFFHEEFFHSFYQENILNDTHYKVIFSRNHLEHDIKKFYGKHLNSKMACNHLHHITTSHLHREISSESGSLLKI
jgi:hypothetical protein